MDLWLSMRDGRTVPLTGVTAVASIDTVGTATEFLGSSITSGSPDVTVSSTAGIIPGSNVYGPGIPTGATVLSITSGTVFVMSANATATIAGTLTVTVTSLTTADQKLLTINSGWYRDQFDNTTPLSYLSTEVGSSTPVPLNAQSAVTYVDPVTATPNAYGSVAFTAPLEASTSDELAHVPLRQATWYESLWAFSCTVGPDTLSLYERKYEVIAIGNVAPTL